MTVRSRFAPSPTGFMHIGNLRTALFAYLTAKHSDGKFILRIEDTDEQRFVPESVAVIYKSLRLAGLIHDEGPDIGGDYGPYVQSERKFLYRQYAEQLIESGHAYRCVCEKTDDAPAVDAEGTRLSDPCRDLSAEQSAKWADCPHVIRQKTPLSGETSFTDLVYGEITLPNRQLDDQILLKSDGQATYNFANVIDDHLMEITHVLRGMEYLTSTPKYNLLYAALGWTPPLYAHLPHIVKDDGKKFSKRDNDASFLDLVDRGYPIPAIINTLALTGWSPGDNRELYLTLAELIADFTVERINNSSAAFSLAKLEYFAGLHIRAMSDAELHAAIKNCYSAEVSAAVDTSLITPLLKARLLRFHPDEIVPKTEFFASLPDYSLDLYIHKKSKTNLETSIWALEILQPFLTDLSEWSHDNLYQSIVALATELQKKKELLLWPLRVAISGMAVTPGGATDIAAILGKDESLRRLQIGINKLKNN